MNFGQVKNQRASLDLGQVLKVLDQRQHKLGAVFGNIEENLILRTRVSSLKHVK